MDEKIKRLMNQKIVEAVGCTEPVAVAFAAASAAKYVGRISKIKAFLSANVIKNALIVCLPGGEGRHGIPLALAVGALFGKSEKGLGCIAGLSSEEFQQAEKFATSGNVSVELSKCGLPLMICVEITDQEGNTACVTIKDKHTNICKIEVNGKEIFKKECEKTQEEEISFGISDAIAFSKTTKDFELVGRVIFTNTKMSDQGKKDVYGLSLGCIKSEDTPEDKLLDNLGYIIRRTTAGVDARMAGVDLPVMSTCGSGNQGLIVSLPVIAACEVLKVDEETMKRAVTLSELIAILIKSKHSVLSAYCGAVTACCGVAAAIVFLCGGNESQIKMAIQNLLGNNFGMLCDGAKETCSVKVANCTFSAVYSAYLAKNSVAPKMREGLISQQVENTIENVARLCNDTSDSLDDVLISIMLSER
jgi:L-cysteine desulfidase